MSYSTSTDDTFSDAVGGGHGWMAVGGTTDRALSGSINHVSSFEDSLSEDPEVNELLRDIGVIANVVASVKSGMPRNINMWRNYDDITERADQDRALCVLFLRLLGYSIQEISMALHVSMSTVYKMDMVRLQEALVNAQLEGAQEASSKYHKKRLSRKPPIKRVK